MWNLYERYAGLAETIRNLAQTPSAGIFAFSRSCRRLEAMGFPLGDAVLIMDMTCESAAGWARMAITSDNDDTITESLRRSWNDAASSDEQTAKHIRLMEEIIIGTPKDWWLRKLDILLDGAATRRKV